LTDRFAKTGKRSEIYLSTKFGGATWNTERPNNGDPEYMRQQLELSLKNLQTNYIDLYIFHRVDPNVPIEVTVEAMAELVK
jgi:aryl-alcohol dehydrogenase-like predicted oxidoreductase